MPDRLLDISRYVVSEAARAAGIDPLTLKQWIARELIPLAPWERAANPGSRHFLTLRRVLQIALTAELVRLGIPVQRAATAALAFTDAGTSKRRPGELFPDGYTVLVVPADPEGRDLLNVKDGFQLTGLFTKSSGAAVVLVNHLYDEVRVALKLREAA